MLYDLLYGVDRGLYNQTVKIFATLHADARLSEQSSSITVYLARAGFEVESFLAKFHVSAMVREECRWSHDSASTLRLKRKNDTKLIAANYGIRKWEQLSVDLSLKNLVAEVELAEVSLDGDMHRQVALIKFKQMLPAEPFEDRVNVSLYSTTKDVSIKVGEISTSVELPAVVAII